MKTRYCLLIAALLLSLASNRALSQNIFAAFDGIEGESTVAGHEGQIDVLVYDHSLTNTVAVEPGGVVPGQAIHSAIFFSKYLDKSTPPLIDRLNKGTRIADGKFEFETTGTSQLIFLKVELTGVYVNNYSISGVSEGGIPTENLSVLYEAITITYREIIDGELGPPIVVTWNIIEQQLPVEMVSLNVRVVGSDLIFQWQTLSESGNYGFEIQHLESGGFRRAAYVPAAGWSTQPLEYEVRIRGLEEGIHVFRVASLGLGGRITYSQELTVAIGVSEEGTLAVDTPYPNPFNDRTNIAVSVAREEQARISVWDMLGREIAVVYNGTLQPGAQARFVFNPELPLAPGVYAVQVKTDRDIATRLVTVAR